jgi:ATP-dependent Zn protease
MFARALDNGSNLRDEIEAGGSPVVLVTANDIGALEVLTTVWDKVLLPTGYSEVPGWGLKESHRGKRAVISYIATSPNKPADLQAYRKSVRIAAQLAIPVVAIAPQIQSYLPEELGRITTHSLTIPPLDSVTITRTIRIVTGKQCARLLCPDLAAGISVEDLLLYVRYDRSPDECLTLLKIAAEARLRSRAPRDLTLDELHGLDEAVAWARSTICDLQLYREGRLAWHEIDHGVVLNGPTGTGKTLFAQVFASEAGLPIVTGSLAKWQSADEGHLGHLLKAMRQDFAQARSRAPCIVFIDEVDAFASRDELTHRYRDYSVQVVNGFLELLDGISSREGLIFIAASNNVTRCDPAILRAGRLNRVIQVPLPSPTDLEKMFRVRLRGDLSTADLSGIATLAKGVTGADVEKAVKDARRIARQSQRSVTLDDLIRAVGGEPTIRSQHELWRIAVHEAGHGLVLALRGGADSISVAIHHNGPIAGSSIRGDLSGLHSHSEWKEVLIEILAGRAAEEVLLGSPGIGSGGGPASDLALATRIGAALVGSYGVSGPHPLVYIAPPDATNEILSQPYMRTAVSTELENAYHGALDLVRQHKDATIQIARNLTANGHVSGGEISRIIRLSRSNRLN